MNWKTNAGVAVPLALALLVEARDAQACGGCFHPPTEVTQVTGHRMVWSIGKDQSTLYDQIEYSGSPESFAWVLPVKGQVDVGVSSDLLFNQLGFDSQVTIQAPIQTCPAIVCDGPSAVGAWGDGVTGATSGGGVDVIAQEVVGPYETVQLASSDPGALAGWLEGHGYELTADVEPLIGNYVKEGFNFLAVKLVPGQGVQAMQPIRVTTKGAAVSLPLRMVAAGTGAVTTMTLFVVGEGRWATANFPGFTLSPDDVVWDYAQDRSNYTQLRTDAYAKSKGMGWLTEAASPYSSTNLRVTLSSVLTYNGVEASGYAGTPAEAAEALDADLDTLFSGMDAGSIWLTRLRAELPREALGTDLVLEAASTQDEVSRLLQTTKFIGPQPACPAPPPGCEVEDEAQGGGCALVASSRASELLFAGGLAVMGVLARRRRGRRG
ncbi:MAG: DUF2330 domain-containing protein [Deltaproteobacteria bacterium]|nr:DUF2330 domain-containing protein [Deltaproteobacteria bacterium]